MFTFPPPPADLHKSLGKRLKPKATTTGVVLGSGTYGSVIELTSAREQQRVDSLDTNSV